MLNKRNNNTHNLLVTDITKMLKLIFNTIHIYYFQALPRFEKHLFKSRGI